MAKQSRGVGFSKAVSGLLFGAALGLCSLTAHAALMVTAGNQTFTENFDSLAIIGSSNPQRPNWLLREQQWKRDPEHRVVVLFPGEDRPLITGEFPLAPQ